MTGTINQQGILTYYGKLFDWIDEPQGLPAKVIPNVQPIIDINPLSHPILNIALSVTAFGTIYTTPTNTDFYLTSFSMGFQEPNQNYKDISIKAYINNIKTVVGTIQNGVSGDSLNLVYSFPFPLIIDRNTDITFETTGSFTSVIATIQGFTYNSNPTGLQSINY